MDDKKLEEFNHRFSSRLGEQLFIPLIILIFFIIGTQLFPYCEINYFGAVDSDLTNQFYPWQVFISRWFNRGVFPYWDPHIFYGYPTLETQQMLALNPVHLLTTLLTPPRIALAFQIFAHILIAYVGMIYLCGRTLKLGMGASITGAAVFILGTLFAVRVSAGHFTVVAALAWWPWAVSIALIIARSRTKSLSANKIFNAVKNAPAPRLIFGGSIVHCMVILAGGPQYIIYLFWMEIVIILSVSRERFTALFRLGIIWVFAVLLSAPQWLPSLWYFPYSVRGNGSSMSLGTSISSVEKLNLLLEFLFPYPFGDDIRQPHLHFKNVWETATWPGAPAIVFSISLLGFWFRSTLKAVFKTVKRTATPKPVRLKTFLPSNLSSAQIACLSLIGLGIYLTFGGWLPGFSGFREPTKARAIIAFAAALTTAVQYHRFERSPRKTGKGLFASSLLLLIATTLFWMKFKTPDSFTHLITQFGLPFDLLAAPFYYETLQNPAKAISHFTNSYYAVLIPVSILTLCFAVAAFKGDRTNYAVLVLGLTIWGLAQQNSINYKSRSPYSSIELPESLSSFAHTQLSASPEKSSPPVRFILDPTIINKTHLMDGFYETRGYDPLMPNNANNRQLLYNFGKPLPTDNDNITQLRFNATGIRFDISNWTPQSTSPLSIQTAKTIATSSSILSIQRNISTDLPEDMNFGPSLEGVNYLSSHELAKNNFPENQSSTKQIQAFTHSITERKFPLENESFEYIDRKRPDEYGIKVNLTSPAAAILSSTWLPGWQYSINGGKYQPALCANKWMVAAPVDQTSREIIFRYRPVFFTQSLLISGITLLFLALLPFLRKRSKSETMTNRRSPINYDSSQMPPKK